MNKFKLLRKQPKASTVDYSKMTIADLRLDYEAGLAIKGVIDQFNAIDISVLKKHMDAPTVGIVARDFVKSFQRTQSITKSIARDIDAGIAALEPVVFREGREDGRSN